MKSVFLLLYVDFQDKILCKLRGYTYMFLHWKYLPGQSVVEILYLCLV